MDIKDSGYLPLLGLQVNKDPSLSIFIRTIYIVLLITNITIRIQEGFYARQNTKLKKHLQCFLLTDRFPSHSDFPSNNTTVGLWHDSLTMVMCNKIRFSTTHPLPTYTAVHWGY